MAKSKTTTRKPAKRKTDENAPTDVVPVTATKREVIELAGSLDQSLIKATDHKLKEGEQRSDPTQKSNRAAAIPTAVVATASASPPTPATAVVNAMGVAAGAKSVLFGMRIAFHKPPHVIVRARAGTGKTTTLIEGLKLLKGLPTSITPSTQQRTVWDAILESKDRCRFITFVAFNSSIADELKKRVPEGVMAMTMHSLGFAAIRRAFNPIPNVDDKRTERIIADLLHIPMEEAKDKQRVVLNATTELVGLCKMNLLNGTETDLDQLIARHDVDLGEQDRVSNDEADRIRRTVYDLVPNVLNACKQVHRDNCIDYDDMVWLPVVLNLNVFRSNLLLVDEFQDTNRCQQELAKRAGERLIVVGDDRQAIYGFAGADSESIDRFTKDMGGVNPRDPQEGGYYRVGMETRKAGCVVLPLTVTRRCGKAIVKEAQRYVPDFEAHESNGEGKIETLLYPLQRTPRGLEAIPEEESYLPHLKDNDMILCRANATLVSQYFKIIKRGQPAFIRGRKDVSKRISSLITKQKADTVPDMLKSVDAWHHREIAKENAKANPSDSKIMSVTDLRDCVFAFAENATDIKDVLRKIDNVFSDSTRPGVQLSSIHKAKGLESERVFFLAPGGHRSKSARSQDWEWQQELNLRYVGITRAIKELYYVF